MSSHILLSIIDNPTTPHSESTTSYNAHSHTSSTPNHPSTHNSLDTSSTPAPHSSFTSSSSHSSSISSSSPTPSSSHSPISSSSPSSPSSPAAASLSSFSSSSPSSSVLPSHAQASLTFSITKAHIKESLEAPFSIECEGYIESMQQDILHIFTSQSLDKSLHTQGNSLGSPAPLSSSAFLPHTLLDKQAILCFHNPHSSLQQTPSPLDTHQANPSSYQTYQGIITHINYLGYDRANQTNLPHPLSPTHLAEHIKAPSTPIHSPALESPSPSHPLSSKPAHSPAQEHSLQASDTLSALSSLSTSELKFRHRFSFTLSSALVRLSYNQANRIYTDKSIPEVIRLLLAPWSPSLHKELSFSLLNHYHTEDIITQYNESDLSFLLRIAHNHGIYIYEDSHSIYISDHLASSSHKSVLYNTDLHNALNKECIHTLSKHSALAHNSFIHSYMNANNPLESINSIATPSHIHQPYNHTSTSMGAHPYAEHIYQANLSFHSSPCSPLPLKSLHYQMLEEILYAQSNIHHLSLAESLLIQQSQPSHSAYHIIAIEHTLLYKEHITEHEQTNYSYTNTLTLLPTHIPFIPPQRPKPMPPIHTQGIVVGEDYMRANSLKSANDSIQAQANTIYADEFHRIRVRLNIFYAYALSQEQLHTHTDTSQTESSPYSSLHLNPHAPFLRILSPIASNQSGFYAIPRVGDEVLVSYLDNDIDKPFISGSLYNSTNPPLTDAHTSLSSKSIGTQEEGVNSLTLKHTKDKEEICLHAQKDYTEVIKHNHNQTILNNKEATIKGSHTESITKYHHQSILGAKNIQVGAEYLTNVALSKDTIVGLSHTLNIGESNKLRVAKDSSEYIGGDKNIEVKGSVVESVSGDYNAHIGGNKKEMVEKHFSMHSSENLHLSANDEVAITSQNDLLLSTKQSFALRSDENLTIHAKDIYTKARQELRYLSDEAICLSLSSKVGIELREDKIILRVKENELILDENGLSLNTQVNIKGK